MLSMVLGEPHPSRDGEHQWWVEPADEPSDEVAAARGLRVARRLFQLRRDLPLPPELGSPAATRQFRPGLDERPWLEVNAAAFEWHHDQGRWTIDDLHQAMAEPWFDPEGFRLHEVDGQLAGFCWTKVHSESQNDPMLGEIFVIAVAPAFQGRGLGRALTAAGLEWLWRHHRPTTAMLYVETDNTAGIALYESMGFAIHHQRVAYARPVAT